MELYYLGIANREKLISLDKKNRKEKKAVQTAAIPF
jgi:hypothetical protein